MDLLLVAIYGIVDSPKENMKLMTQIFRACVSRGIPYVVHGDFNVEPDILKQHLVSEKLWTEVFDCGPTCWSGDSKPSHIDFFACRADFASAIQKPGSFMTTLATHRPVHYSLRRGGPVMLCVQQTVPARPATKAVCGPRPNVERQE